MDRADTDELERIRQAYRRYEQSDRENARRDYRNRGLRSIRSELRTALVDAARTHGRPLEELRVFDVGCGGGELLEWIVAAGVPEEQCGGLDLMQGRVDATRERLPKADVVLGDAGAIPRADGSVDVVVMSMVITSVRDDQLARRICAEAARITARDGIVIWYDTHYPNPFNKDVRGVSRRALTELFPGFELQTRSLTLLPPLARTVGHWMPWSYRALMHVRPLRARTLAVLRRPT